LHGRIALTKVGCGVVLGTGFLMARTRKKSRRENGSACLSSRPIGGVRVRHTRRTLLISVSLSAPRSDPMRPESPLLTDLYQLNMIQAYLDHGDTETAVFEFFVRTLPRRRGFLLAAGLEQALDYLEAFRFTGSVHAVPEGTAFFASEPILRITAPLPEAQFVETRLINIL